MNEMVFKISMIPVLLLQVMSVIVWSFSKQFRLLYFLVDIFFIVILPSMFLCIDMPVPAYGAIIEQGDSKKSLKHKIIHYVLWFLVFFTIASFLAMFAYAIIFYPFRDYSFIKNIWISTSLGLLSVILSPYIHLLSILVTRKVVK